MRSRHKLPPEEVVKLREAIEHYLWWQNVREEMGDSPPGEYEQRETEALRAHNPKFFDDVAALCRETSERRVFSQGDEQEVKRIAVLTRLWLKYRERPVTGDTVRRLTETIWAARLIGYKPTCFLRATKVFTEASQETFEFLTPSEGERPKLVSIEIDRAGGTWSEFDYITLLFGNLEDPKATELRDNIDHARRSFPKSAWKRVWQDPSLVDIKPKRGRPRQ
jgi:hypothetical protein